MRVSTNLGKMSRRRRHKVSDAMVEVLMDASDFEMARALQALKGLRVEDTAVNQDDIERWSEKFVRATALSSSQIRDRLPEKYQLHVQQITRLLWRIEFPGNLSTISKRTHQEFIIEPEVVPPK